MCESNPTEEHTYENTIINTGAVKPDAMIIYSIPREIPPPPPLTQHGSQTASSFTKKETIVLVVISSIVTAVFSIMVAGIGIWVTVMPRIHDVGKN